MTPSLTLLAGCIEWLVVVECIALHCLFPFSFYYIESNREPLSEIVFSFNSCNEPTFIMCQSNVKITPLPKVPQLKDSEADSRHDYNYGAWFCISLKPRKQPLGNKIKRRAAIITPPKTSSLPPLSSPLRHVDLLDAKDFCFNTPKPSSGLLIVDNRSRQTSETSVPAIPHLDLDLSSIPRRLALNPRKRKMTAEVTAVSVSRFETTPMPIIEYKISQEAVFETPIRSNAI
jgi:hypothetical protein